MPNKFQELGTELGELVAEKNIAYGNSFVTTADVMKVDYPDGIPPNQYINALLLVRIFDKTLRISNGGEIPGESPFKDIAGYGLCGWSLVQK